MNPTDEELDRDWQPNGRRPQSTIARSFSAELMDIFRIENSVADLDEQLNKRKEKVNTHNTELEALEKRIKEMEARLKRSSGQGQGTAAQTESQRQDAKSLAADKDTAAQMASAQRSMGTSRPGTAKQPQQAPAHGGAMPPTPTASEGEYELVDPSTAFAFPQPNHYGSNGLATQSFTDMVLVYKDGDRDS
ncbi:hypothetical protein PG996_004308 [Apiospora saccharicola]|uniref:Uncharacterized protein n=1 Tax=Apiospora saccharicola TaxID=335842 RepID=A0ABR1W7I8_9PEZI